MWVRWSIFSLLFLYWWLFSACVLSGGFKGNTPGQQHLLYCACRLYLIWSTSDEKRSFCAVMCFQRKLGWNVYFTDFNSCSFKGQNLSVCVCVYVCVSVRTACNLIILDSYTSYLWLVDFQRGVVKLLLFDVLCCKSVRALVACSFCFEAFDWSLYLRHIYTHTQYVY